MFGWRARIGVLLPPGNPTVEPELWGMAPAGVSLHFGRLETPPSVGKSGLAEGMEERTRFYRDGLAGPTAALSQVQPAVVVLAHTPRATRWASAKTRRWLIRSRGWPA